MEKLGVYFYIACEYNNFVEILSSKYNNPPFESSLENVLDWKPEIYLNLEGTDTKGEFGLMSIGGDSDVGRLIREQLFEKKDYYKVRNKYPIAHVETLLSDVKGHFLDKHRLINMLYFLEDMKIEGYCFAHEVERFPKTNCSWILLGAVQKFEGKYRSGISKSFFKKKEEKQVIYL